MRNTRITVTLGQAAEKNGQELGLINEENLLKCIKQEDWIREEEASLLTGLSQQMVGKVGRRLAAKDEIYRERVHGNAGYFLRLKVGGAERVDGKSGKDVIIPASWRHDSLAIQVLNALADEYGCAFETETSIRHSQNAGKIPDGRLIDENRAFYFEQELSRKSGAAMQKQADEVFKQAQGGTTCLIAYPYPPEFCGGVDHEYRQTSAIRNKWGSQRAQNIRLVRCHFDSRLDFMNMHVNRVEIIALPCMYELLAAQNSAKESGGGTDQQWLISDVERRDAWSAAPNRKHADLVYNDEYWFRGEFAEAKAKQGEHILLSDKLIIARSENGKHTFDEFIAMQIQKIWLEQGEDIKKLVADKELLSF